MYYSISKNFLAFLVLSIVGIKLSIDGSYQPKVYRQQGGDIQVVKSGGEIKMEAGGIISANGTQASNIATFTATGTFSTGIAAKIISLIAAVEGVGITAT
jgi:hypothetical protein